jgi:hypothetical protein
MYFIHVGDWLDRNQNRVLLNNDRNDIAIARQAIARQDN